MATPELETLLVVQEHDATIDRLKHRRDTLPEKAALAELERRRTELGVRLAEVTEARDVQLRREQEVEADLTAVEKRVKELDQRLYSASAGVRDMEAISGEISSLKRRRSMLEDEVLEMLEAREPLDAEVASLSAQHAEMGEAAAAMEVSIAEAEALIDVEADAERVARAAVAGQLSEQLTAQYERLRDRLGGVGAARLVGASCTGCHLSLPATELDRIKRAPDGEIFTCDQCGRILVR